MRAVTRRSLQTAALAGVVVLALGACSGSAQTKAAKSNAKAMTSRHPRSTTTSTSSSTTTTSSTTAPFNGLRPGDSGPRVAELRQQLANQHYDVSPEMPGPGCNTTTTVSTTTRVVRSKGLTSSESAPKCAVAATFSG